MVSHNRAGLDYSGTDGKANFVSADFEGDRSERALLVEVGQHHHLDIHRVLQNLYQRAASPWLQNVCFLTCCHSCTILPIY
jgi:hypothetical protein